MNSTLNKIRVLMMERGWDEAVALELVCRFIDEDSILIGQDEGVNIRLERFLGEVVLEEEKMGKDDS